MTSLVKQIKSVLQLAPQGTLEDDGKFTAFIDQFVGAVGSYDGEDGEPLGEDKAREMLVAARDKVKQKRENDAAAKANKAKVARLEAHQSSASEIELSEAVVDFVRAVNDDGGKVTLEVDENGLVNLVVGGIKVRRGGNRGGGRIPKGKRSGFLDHDGNSILGPVTEYVYKSGIFSEETLKDKNAWRPNGMTRSGVALAKAMGFEPDPLGRYDSGLGSSEDSQENSQSESDKS